MKAVDAILAVMPLALFFFPLKSLAGDYKVHYAIDARGVVETGETTECSYDRSCQLVFKELRINLDVTFQRDRLRVDIYGRDGGCCHFYDGDTHTIIDNDKKYSKLTIYEGIKRRGNEVVRNIRIGTLYLTFKHLP